MVATMPLTRPLLLSGLLIAIVVAPTAWAAPTRAEAERVFGDARAICERDGGRLWGRSLCGPMFLVDWRDRAVLANGPDGGGALKPGGGGVFEGVLPEALIVANTPTDWSGARWTQLVSPTPDEADKRHVLIAHELFHRIQEQLGLTRPERPNGHLDTLEGRYLIQLEWRALARALSAATPAARRAAVSDALAFRHERHRLFPAAAGDEAALEIAEGVPEYTGVRLGLTTEKARTAFALYDLQAFTAAPTFVRSFAYASGPAYGLLLDRSRPGWRSELGADARLGSLLASAMRIEPSNGEAVGARARRYDDGALRTAEVRRDADRRARLTAFRERLVDGPVLSLPLRKTNYQFNPQTLVPLEGAGTIYPTMRLVDAWGSLEVESGGALVWSTGKRATVSARGAATNGLTGEGWKLTLNPGWRTMPGARRGDLTLVGPGS